jgi:hypothetical protein
MAKKNRNGGYVQQTRKKVEIQPINETQRSYIDAIDRNNITFGVGSAGTGKSYLAAMLAMEAMTEKRVNRIVIARPAVTAGGEDIGFLPGSITAKMDPATGEELVWARSPGALKNHPECAGRPVFFFDEWKWWLGLSDAERRSEIENRSRQKVCGARLTAYSRSRNPRSPTS